MKEGCIDKLGYLYEYKPLHPKSTKQNKYIGQHVLVMEEYLSILFDEQIYIPKGYHVHHINYNRKDNRLINLELLSKSKHKSHHMTGKGYLTGKHRIDVSGRRCCECGSDNTYKRRQMVKGGLNTSIWFKHPDNPIYWWCGKCYGRDRYRRLNKCNL